jgi:uncharacterized membrane protein
MDRGIQLVRRNGEKGQALIFVAVGMVVLLAFMALAIDVGYMRYLRRELQTAADSAAISGAAELNFFGPSGNYTCAAQYDASNNGFTPSDSSCAAPGQVPNNAIVTVTLNTSLPGCTGGTPTCVQVTIQETHHFSLRESLRPPSPQSRPQVWRIGWAPLRVGLETTGF